jgi:hypothetical protein
MRSLSALLVLLLTVLGTGCASSDLRQAARLANEEAAASGSPFRWEPREVRGDTVLRRIMLDLPAAGTSADAQLQQDILALITKAERTQGRPAPAVTEIRNLPKGREVWVLKSAAPDEAIAYIVALRPASQGGTDIVLTGPTPFTPRGSP